ncbi:extracellular solute-binding protein [Lacrimispora celerecrescens]|uniref:extracellular solute-binding protein n=1 Tax=Lacrimispora celerecrescens TaxID=29354 RepID=UPI0016464C87|nr:extracellular solute-binding protein [Lacrimispora celerecrescens]
MVTIKDIARAAGVAQGTVSNVLNEKGNVSSEKIKQVMDAAASLGYIPNERAKLLRKGRSDLLAVILPNLRSKQYLDFFMSFKAYAENHNYSVCQYLTNDDQPDAEINALQDIRSLMPAGIASFTSFTSQSDYIPYLDGKKKIRENIIFIERDPDISCKYIGFNYGQAGKELAKKALEKKYTNICILTGSLRLSNELAFYDGFMDTMKNSSCSVSHIQTDSYRKLQNVMQIFHDSTPQAIFISNYGFAESVKDIHNTFYPELSLNIHTVSPVFTLPENDFDKYELNYRQLGKIAAETLIENDLSGKYPEKRILENSGFRDWFSNIIYSDNKSPLNILTLDTPSAYTLRSLSRLYTQKTGIPVNITIYSYDEIYEAFTNMSKDSVFDILRLDVTWLSWFAEKILQPLDGIDPSVAQCLNEFIDGTIEPFSMINGHVYALPTSPSMQLLFYRKDLFNDPIYRRTYFEKYREELLPPDTFDKFNRIAAFFTKSLNPASPVDYGATLTLGSTGVAGSEFLARFFSYQDNLYDEHYNVALNSPAAVRALEQLVEIRNYSSPKYNSWWTNTATSFAGGNIAMTLLYSNYASDLLSSTSKVVGNIGYALVPGGNPVIGGGTLGVSKYSRRSNEALSFIRWICSETIASAETLLGSVSPCKKSYENYEIVNSYPWLNFAKDCFVMARGRRVPELSGFPFDERRFLSIIGMAVKNAYSNVQSPKVALDHAQKMYNEQFLNRD